MNTTTDFRTIFALVLSAVVFLWLPLSACGHEPDCEAPKSTECEEEPGEPQQPTKPEDPEESEETETSEETGEPKESQATKDPEESEETEPPSFCPVCWDLEQAQFSQTDLDLSESTRDPRSIEFHPDGDRLYLVSRTPRKVFQFQLESPWDIESASVVEELNLEQDSIILPHGLHIRQSDGAKMWVFNRTEIHEYTLSSPWKVSTAEHTGQHDLDGSVGRGHDIDFSPDGERLFIDDRRNQVIAEFSMAPPWDTDSAKLVDTLDISEVQKQVRSIEFHPDGTGFFLVDTRRRDLLEFSTPNPWRLEDAEFIRSFDLWDESDDPRSITWRTDGSRFFVTGTAEGRLFEYVVAE